ncbi:hypothetical protein, partial [Mesorhizobium sp. LNHC232B00]|uniref:hypothetical protein n=1 Tax=Mesorhizobium sp. LNHC232B00 TaxID=1287243 RepID=UPI001AEC4782
MNIPHLVSLAQQFAEGSHLSIDGCVAVAALAQGDILLRGEVWACPAKLEERCPSREMGDSSFRIDGLHFRPFAR